MRHYYDTLDLTRGRKSLMNKGYIVHLNILYMKIKRKREKFTQSNKMNQLVLINRYMERSKVNFLPTFFDYFLYIIFAKAVYEDE